MTVILAGSSGCSSGAAEEQPATAMGATQAMPASGGAGAKPNTAGRVAVAAAAAGSPSAAGSGGAGVSGSAGGAGLAAAAGTSGSTAQTPAEDDDADAGTMPGSATEVTIIAQAAFAMPAPALTIEGAACAAGRCTLQPPADGKLKVALVLEHGSSGEPMPVLARWNGCGMPTTTFFPQTPSGTSYVINYESQFSDLHAGSTCTAEIVQGAWLIFAGNMSLKIAAGEDYCTTVQVSEMGINASCFPPPGIKVAIESDLPRWDCVNIAPDGTAKDTMHMQQMLSFTSEANHLVSCTGAAQ